MPVTTARGGVDPPLVDYRGEPNVLVVKADLDACMGYANCVMAAEEYFDLEAEGAVVTIRHTVIKDGDRARVEEAVRSCPVNALSLEEK
jgi:3-phenylpropionate/trans-cinnamate dioxygenase ferredoxin reductase subunit